MARITRAAAHLTREEVKTRMRTDPRPLYRQRWLIIYTALAEPRKAEEIARHSGVSKATVHQVISTYNRLGVGAVETPGKGGRRHQYLTREEEEQFLAPFFARAEAGEIATVREIWQAFETRVGHQVDDSTISRLRDRHGWRKLMPRPRHPQADQQAQEPFQKPLQRRLKRQSQRGHPKMSARSSSWGKMKGVLAASAALNAGGPRPASGRRCQLRWYESRCRCMRRSLLIQG